MAEFALEWRCQKYTSPIIDQKANELLEKLGSIEAMRIQVPNFVPLEGRIELKGEESDRARKLIW